MPMAARKFPLHANSGWGADQGFLHTIDEIVTEERIGKAISSFDCYRPPGCDGMYPIMLTHGGDVLIALLTDLFSACLRLRHTPPCWSWTRVAFLPKPGKKSYQMAKDFRPIPLTSFFKTLERLVYWNLRGVWVMSPTPTPVCISAWTLDRCSSPCSGEQTGEHCI